MPVEFAIIPIDRECDEYAMQIKTKIEEVVSGNIIVDNNYDTPLQKKLIRHKLNCYDIITLTQNNISKNQLTIRYFEKGSRPELLSVDDFIELIKSYYDEETKDNNEKSKDNNHALNIESTNESNDKESSCNIM